MMVQQLRPYPLAGVVMEECVWWCWLAATLAGRKPVQSVGCGPLQGWSAARGVASQCQPCERSVNAFLCAWVTLPEILPAVGCSFSGASVAAFQLTDINIVPSFSIMGFERAH